MADLNIALILRLVDKATAPARKATEALRRIGGDGFLRAAGGVNRGAVQMASGLGTVAGAATRTAFSLQGLIAGAGVVALGRSMIQQASSFENYKVQLETLEGSSAGAERALTWIEDFAVKTPLQVNEVVDSYAKLRAFGLDPTNGTMMALVDTMAATGGGAEKLEGLTLALGQAWTKGKLQGEEAMQLLERGVPVYDLLAKATGKTTEEIVAMQSAGELGREEITLLIEAMGAANKDAAIKMSQTWDGIVSNIWDQWTRFQRKIMDSGLFKYMKDGLQNLLDMLNDMAADGRLQAWAEQTSAAIITGLQAIWDFGAGVVDVWRALSPWVRAAAEAVGGFENALAILIGLKFAPALLSIAGGFGSIALAMGPLGWAAAGVAAVGYLIYSQWEWVTETFDWARMKAKQFLDFIMSWTFEPLEAALRAAFDSGFGAAKQLLDFIMSWTFEPLEAAIRAAFDIDFIGIGTKMINDLWTGMRAVMDQLVTWGQEKLNSIAPAWLTNLSAGGSAVIGGEGNYGGMGGAMDDSAAFAGRALGGPVRAGQTYSVQEEGRELFTPRTDGSIISTRQLRGAGGGGSRSVSIGGITINAAAGQSAMDIARAVRAEIDALAREAGFALHDGGMGHA